MDKKSLEQVERRNKIPEKIEGIEKERPIHIQVVDGKNKTETNRSVQEESKIRSC